MAAPVAVSSVVSLGDTYNLYSIIYAGGKYIAVGNDTSGTPTILYSTSGTSWTKAAVNQGSFEAKLCTFYAVTYGAGKYVAVGSRGVIATSSNGTSWTIVRYNYSDSAFYDVAYGNGKFAAIYDSPATAVYFRGSIYYSSDAVNWTNVVIPHNGNASNTPNAYFRKIIFFNGYFVAFTDLPSGYYSSTSYIKYSSDAVTWNSSFSGDYYQIYSVAQISKLCMALMRTQSSNGSYTYWLFTSENGINWEQKYMNKGGILASSEDIVFCVNPSGTASKYGIPAVSMDWIDITVNQVSAWEAGVYANNVFTYVSSSGDSILRITGWDEISNGKIWIGISEKARKGVNLYVGVNGKARKAIGAWVGVNGKARRFL